MRRKRISEKWVRQEHWEGHERVHIRGSNAADQRWVSDFSGHIDATGAVEIKVGAVQYATALRGILEWTLTNEHGQPMLWPQMGDTDWQNTQSKPYLQRVKSLDDLAPEDLNFLISEIGKMNETMSKEEQDTFLESATPGSSENIRPFHQPLSIAK